MNATKEDIQTSSTMLLNSVSALNNGNADEHWLRAIRLHANRIAVLAGDMIQQIEDKENE